MYVRMCTILPLLNIKKAGRADALFFFNAVLGDFRLSFLRFFFFQLHDILCAIIDLKKYPVVGRLECGPSLP